MRRTAIVVSVGAIALLAFAPPAGAVFPAANGKIGYTTGGDIWTINPDGTGNANITNSAITESCALWAPNGGKIAFFREPGIDTAAYVADPDGTNLKKLTGSADGTGCPLDWSPDSAKVTWTIDDHCDAGGVWNSFVSSPTAEQVACGPPICDWDTTPEQPDWAPNGQKMAMVGCNFGIDPTIDLWIVNLTGSPRLTQLTNTPPGMDEQRPDFSPDSTRIVYMMNGIRVINADGTGDTLLVQGGLPEWSPTGDKIAYLATGTGGGSDVWTINPDGTGAFNVTNAAGNDGPFFWSPDRQKFVFSSSRSGNSEIYTINRDGTGLTQVTNTPTVNEALFGWQPIPTANPGADMLATISDSPDPIPAGGRLHYTVSAKNFVGPDDGTGVTLTVNLDPNAFFVSATPTQGSCSQASNEVTCQLGNVPRGSSASADITIEPRFPTPISASGTVHANEADPNSANNTASTTTTITSGGQPRPKGATPLRASLAIAYKACAPGDENEQHGGPLNVPSCSPPTQSSSYLTVGTLDANGQPAGFVGSVRFDVIEGDTNPNNGDQADVALHASLTDVRNKPSLTDYTGELEGQTTLRITDHDNSAGYFAAATVEDMPLDYTIPCTATGGAVGSSCQLSTTVDALTGGGVKELKRAIWQLDRVRVSDGGADGDVATAPNTMFATQGVFVP